MAALTTVRVYSPSAKTSTHPSGRGYTLSAGGILDIPEGELDQMDWADMGLVVLGSALGGNARSGTTANRPTYASARPPQLGEPYFDTTLSAPVFFVGPKGPGGRWVNMAGSTV